VLRAKHFPKGCGVFSHRRVVQSNYSPPGGTEPTRGCLI
jgi:hypothetical protein